MAQPTNRDQAVEPSLEVPAAQPASEPPARKTTRTRKSAAKAIDAISANSDHETRTLTEQAATASWMASWAARTRTAPTGVVDSRRRIPFSR